MSSKDTGKKIAVGAVLAGIAGYVTGILTAPKSGKQTRTDIKNKAGEIKKTAQEELKQAHDDLTKIINSARSKSINLGASARIEFNEAVIRAKDARNKGAHIIKAVKSGSADDPQLNQAVKQMNKAKKNLEKYLKK